MSFAFFPFLLPWEEGQEWVSGCLVLSCWLPGKPEHIDPLDTVEQKGLKEAAGAWTYS